MRLTIACARVVASLFTFLAIGPAILGNPSVQLTRGPYLQLGGENTMTVVWQTDLPSEGHIEFGPTVELGTSATSGPTPEIEHVVTIGSLEPGTTYHYRVVCEERVLADNRLFRTFPSKSSNTPFRVVFWGDSGDDSESQRQLVRAYSIDAS